MVWNYVSLTDLDPGEPYGAFLSPTEQPYDRKERVDLFNHLLQNSQPPTRRLPIRVRIREEYNQYFNEESGIVCLWLHVLLIT